MSFPIEKIFPPAQFDLRFIRQARFLSHDLIPDGPSLLRVFCSLCVVALRGPNLLRHDREGSERRDYVGENRGVGEVREQAMKPHTKCGGFFGSVSICWCSTADCARNRPRSASR
jgi:hypothetical protein